MCVSLFFFYRRSLTLVPSGSQRTAGALCGPPDHFCSPGRRLSAVQLSWSCLPPRNHTTARYINVTQRWKVIFTLRTSTGTYANVQVMVLPGNPIISAGRPLCCSASTSLLHCVVFPTLSTPSSTMSAPRLHAIAANSEARTSYLLFLRAKQSDELLIICPPFTEESRRHSGSRTTHFRFRLLFLNNFIEIIRINTSGFVRPKHRS